MKNNRISIANILNLLKPKKRVVFFVLLAVLVFGASTKISFAVKSGLEDPPKPGTPVSQLSPTWKTAFESTWVAQYMWYEKDSQGNKIVPKTAFRYEAFLKGVGDYTQEERFQAAQKYKSDLGSEAPVDNQRLQQYETGQASHGSALGGAIGNTLASAVWQVVIGVLAILAYFCKVLLMFGGKAMDATLDPSLYNFTNNSMIVGGWTVVRDVCNLFFLLVLLFIAICTILKIEKYHAKKTLLTLIIMALLINFSKPIAIFIFDGSQLLMNMFLSQIMGPSGQGSPSAMLAGDIAKFLYTDLTTELNAQNGSMEIAVYYLFVVVFLFLFAVALFVTSIFLVIRIVAVMLLIIVSPLAFFASIVPDFGKMSSSWWNALFKYCYYGPAAAFFLFLATKFSLATSNTLLPRLNAPGEGNVIGHIIQYFTILVFLYAAIIMSQQFGLFAANTIVGSAGKFMKWAGGMSKGGGMWGAAVRLPEKVPGVSNVYKGVRSGIAQRSGWRMLTKEGREEYAKEVQGRWKERVAPFSISAARKKAKDRENDSEKDIVGDAAKGDAAAILAASKKGFAKDSAGNDLWTNANIIAALKNDDLRKEAYGNLRDKGKTNLVIDAEISRQNISKPADIEKLYENELGGLSPNNLGKQDLGALSSRDEGKKWVENKLKDIDGNGKGSRLITNMLSGGHAKNIQFIRNLQQKGALSNSDEPQRNQSQGNNAASQTGGYKSSGYAP